VDGLPIGVQVVGVRVAERGVLDVAAALERAWRPA
jgi:Asp-tRNA(Asn)/Glu-tRNA(Gln) amidotransferase A subunit family amidase